MLLEILFIVFMVLALVGGIPAVAARYGAYTNIFLYLAVLCLGLSVYHLHV